ncbi:sigma 54 modulation/S30EA ribosomal C-terminal domain-containing protein [Mycolicibacterium frederiksbergense]
MRRREADDFGPLPTEPHGGTKRDMPNGVDAVPAFDLDITTRGVFPGAVEYARIKIGGLGRFTRHPITHARLRLTRGRRDVDGSAVIAQANMDVRGRPVRAQVEAATAREAIDKLEALMRRRLEHVCELWEPHRGPDAAPPWRHAAESGAARPPVTGEARISRRKSYAMAPCTVDEAVAEMEMLGYDFHLFHEIGCAASGVVYRDSPTGLRLALVAPALADQVAPFQLPVSISGQPVPCLREEAAVERMGLLNLPFLFYIDAAAGRASVLYRRLDGDLAVITPAG